MRKEQYLLVAFLIGSLFFPTVVASQDNKVETTKVLVESHRLETPNDSGKTNARKSAEKINGFILEPGATFSFNETIKEVTNNQCFIHGLDSSGNKELYLDGGSGVWRTSTAIFQAVKEAGFEIVERHIICFPETYTKACDSAIAKIGNGPGSKSYLDFKFKNNKEYSIQIECFVDDSALISVAIYRVETPEKIN